LKQALAVLDALSRDEKPLDAELKGKIDKALARAHQSGGGSTPEAAKQEAPKSYSWRGKKRAAQPGAVLSDVEMQFPLRFGTAAKYEVILQEFLFPACRCDGGART
jgi:hypothetical protein